MRHDARSARPRIVGTEDRGYLRMVFEHADDALNAPGRHDHVGIDKEKERALRLLCPAVARRRRPCLLWKAHHTHAHLGGDGRSIIRRRIVHHEALGARRGRRAEGGEALAQLLRTVIHGHNERYADGVPWHASPAKRATPVLPSPTAQHRMAGVRPAGGGRQTVPDVPLSTTAGERRDTLARPGRCAPSTLPWSGHQSGA